MDGSDPMTEPAAEARIAAARAYEDLHVPALFREWCAPMLDAAGVAPGQRVLDVASGTGVLAREALTRVGAEGSVAGVDPDAGMLAVAAELAPGIDWRRGTAAELPFEDGAFDAVVSQFGLMFFPDRARALREMRRVLAPGGTLAVAVWALLEDSEAYPIEVEILERLAGPAAADALRAPFALGDPDGLTALFEDAGLESVRVASRSGTACFPSVRVMVEADLRGWLPVMGVQLEEATIREILAEAETALGRYVAADGRVVFEAPGHIVTGRRPGVQAR